MIRTVDYGYEGRYAMARKMGEIDILHETANFKIKYDERSWLLRQGLVAKMESGILRPGAGSRWAPGMERVYLGTLNQITRKWRKDGKMMIPQGLAFTIEDAERAATMLMGAIGEYHSRYDPK